MKSAATYKIPDPVEQGLEPSLRRASGRYESVLETVGGTPTVRINRLAPPDVNLYVKLEAFNPMGSVKDRLAPGVIEHAERTGTLKPGQTVIDAHSLIRTDRYFCRSERNCEGKTGGRNGVVYWMTFT